MSQLQVGDALAGKTNMGGSAAEEYYAWKLMAEKLQIADSDASEDVKAVLAQTSQKEKIKYAILAKISGPEYAESTAAFAQLQAFAGGARSKMAMAEALAEMVFEKERDEMIMANLIGKSRDYQAIMKKEGPKEKNYFVEIIKTLVP